MACSKAPAVETTTLAPRTSTSFLSPRFPSPSMPAWREEPTSISTMPPHSFCSCAVWSARGNIPDGKRGQGERTRQRLVCLSACMFLGLSVWFIICLPVCLLACLSVCLYACVAAFPACMSVCQPACCVCLSACLLVCLSVCLLHCLACLPVYLTALPDCLHRVSTYGA